LDKKPAVVVLEEGQRMTPIAPKTAAQLGCAGPNSRITNIIDLLLKRG
jgi:hypothetical protein